MATKIAAISRPTVWERSRLMAGGFWGHSRGTPSLSRLRGETPTCGGITHSSLRTASGQIHPKQRAEPEVSCLKRELPLVTCRVAGQQVTCAAEGVVGLKEFAMHAAIPSFVGFTKGPWNKGRLIGQKR